MGFGTSNTSGNGWTLDPGYGSHSVGGFVGIYGAADAYAMHTRVGKASMSRLSSYARSPYFMVAKNHRAAGMAYDAVFGDNFALIGGQTGGSFTPAPGDFLVVSAGVEEYEVIQRSSASSEYAEWYAIALRSV